MRELGLVSAPPHAGASAPASIIHPLDEFYRRHGRPLPSVRTVPSEEVPEPHRALLVHPNDMTSTLELYYRQTVRLNVLSRERHGDLYHRQVVLYLEEGRKPVEFGAIKIRLDLFDEATREGILQERWPLGRILRDETILYSSRPKVFFQLTSDQFMGKVLELQEPSPLYGRRNVLYDPSEQPLAEVVEILPPGEQSTSGGNGP